MATKYADMFSDNRFLLPAGELASWTPTEFVESKLRILFKDHSVASIASAWPRRLGTDATAADLAEDKRLCRKIMHHNATFYRTWSRIAGGAPDLAIWDSEEIRQEAAKLIIPEYAKSRSEVAQYDRSRIVTIAIQTGSRQFANKAAYAFSAEVDSLHSLI